MVCRVLFVCFFFAGRCLSCGGFVVRRWLLVVVVCCMVLRVVCLLCLSFVVCCLFVDVCWSVGVVGWWVLFGCLWLLLVFGCCSLFGVCGFLLDVRC